MSTLSFLVFLLKILQIHYGTVRRRLRMLKETKICRSVNKLMLQPVLCLMVVSHLCLISQYCTYRLTVNDPSSSHAGASEPTLPNDSDQDCQMDVSPPNNRSTSSSIGFGQSSGQTSQGAGSFHPSTPGPFGQHSGGPASSNSFTAPGFFASGSGSNHPTLVPFSGPNSFPSGVPFEANANQFNPDPNQFNQFNTNQSIPIESNPNSFNQFTTSFNQFSSISPIPISSISRRPVSSTSRCPVSSTSRRPISSIHRHSVHLLCLLHLPQWFSLLELHLRWSWIDTVVQWRIEAVVQRRNFRNETVWSSDRLIIKQDPWIHNVVSGVLRWPISCHRPPLDRIITHLHTRAFVGSVAFIHPCPRSDWREIWLAWNMIGTKYWHWCS